MTTEDHERWLDWVPLDSLEPADRNAKDHDLGLMSSSVGRFGFVELITIDERTGKIVAGHGRRLTLTARREAGQDPPTGVRIGPDGEWLVPIVRGWASENDDEALAAGIALNRVGERGGWLREELFTQLDELASTPLGLEGLGFDPTDLDDLTAALGQSRHDGNGATPEPAPLVGPSLAERFGVPPFSVLDARQGYWQDRKRQWLALGIQSELGRPRNLLKLGESGNDPQFYYKKQLAERRIGRTLTTAEFIEEHYTGPDAYTEGTSVFDPVLCELAYRWWSPPAGRVLDPFAGGSVRGVVASALGRRYVGVDLRAEQVEANQQQWETLRQRADWPAPEWLVGDSRTVKIDDETADFVFSCPPYFNLEQYSDDPADLSNAENFEAFRSDLELIVGRAAAALKPNRFACFTVGNVRDDRGELLDVGAATVRAFEKAGLAFYNDAILVTMIGSLALRAGLNFQLRKLAQCHQQVLVFCKGDPERAVDACGPVETVDLAEQFAQGEL